MFGSLHPDADPMGSIFSGGQFSPAVTLRMGSSKAGIMLLCSWLEVIKI